MENSVVKPVKAQIRKEMTAGVLSCAAQAELIPGKLRISYEIATTGSLEIFLVNRLFRWTSAGLALEPDLIYTRLRGQGLELVKACLPVPENLKVESPVVPFLSPVPVGGQWREVVLVDLPVSPLDPYDQLTPSPKPHWFKPVSLSIGWFEAGAVAVRSRESADGSLLYSADYEAVLAFQKILSVTLPIQVQAFLKPAPVPQE